VVGFSALLLKFAVFKNPPSEYEIIQGLSGLEYFALHDGLALLLVVLWSGTPVFIKWVVGKISHATFDSTMID
jgi:hypothetical protein